MKQVEAPLTSGMFYNILAYKERKNIFTALPDLEYLGFKGLIPVCEEFNVPGEIDPPFPMFNVIAYIIILYSIDSFLDSRRYPLRERKLQAAHHAGFAPDKRNEFNPYVNNYLLELEDDRVRDVIHQFMRKHPKSTDKWRMVMILEQNHYEIEKALIAPLEKDDLMKDVKTKIQLTREFEEISNQKNRAIREFYMDHDDLISKEHNRVVMDSIEDWAR